MELLFDERPYISKEIIERCTNKNDYREYLYETLKFIGRFVSKVSCIDPSKSDVREINEMQRAVFIGIVNRISRLVLSFIHISEDGLYGETAKILERCIYESCIRLQWLIQERTDERVRIFISDSLKKDLEFKGFIESTEEKLGYRTALGKQLCDQVQDLINNSFVPEDQIRNSPKLPSFEKICKDLNLNPLIYLLFQRQRSHSIHGSWTDLMLHYLEMDDKVGYVARDHNVTVKTEQFTVIIRVIVDTIKIYIKNLSADDTSHAFIDSYFKEIIDKIALIEKLEFKDDSKRI